MSLQHFARQLICYGADGERTPVLVSDRTLRLKTPFFVELVRQLAACRASEIRIEWCRALGGPLGLAADRAAHRKAARVNRALTRLSRDHLGSLVGIATIEVTATVARPTVNRLPLVIGWCDSPVDLPPWTMPIQLSASTNTSAVCRSSDQVGLSATPG